MMAPNSNSALAFALLGLIGQQPRSGYDLRKFFSSTPLISFSDSPGAIYPALRRLEQRGLVRGHIAEGAGLRRRRIFELTARGRAEFKRWQTQPLTRNDVVRNMDALMLRFAFMDQFAGKAATLRFLKAFRKELAAYIPTLRVYLKSNRGYMSQSGRLALESGIHAYEAQLRWTNGAMKSYRQLKGDR
ncbi:MAG TPA: PadR family transcriptional regulator [Candidatus Acidoferrum sp.]|nr:PadR family transcriptional regulator [Candidatus Acidoferrum sp.]